MKRATPAISSTLIERSRPATSSSTASASALVALRQALASSWASCEAPACGPPATAEARACSRSARSCSSMEDHSRPDHPWPAGQRGRLRLNGNPGPFSGRHRFGGATATYQSLVMAALVRQIDALADLLNLPRGVLIVFLAGLIALCIGT